MTITHVPGKGLIIIFDGFTAVLGEHLSIAAIQSHMRELQEFTE